MTDDSTAANTPGIAVSVTGEVPVAELGVTLPHEHVIHRTDLHSGKADNKCVDKDLMAEELAVFKSAGGGTICDMTPMGVGRDPQALREVSAKSDVYIVSGAGIYQTEVWPDEMRSLSRSELADFLIREVNGEETGITAGIIGEVASHNEDHADWRRYRLRDEEIGLFTTVADVQRRTGLAISTHASLGRAGVAQLRTLIEAGADPTRIVIGHCDACGHSDIQADMEYYHLLLHEGTWVQFDLFGWDELMPDAHRYARVAALIQEGYANRILLSTDTCRLSHLHRSGGRGFDYLFTTVLPSLRKAGVTEQNILQMTVTNPAQILARAATC